MQTQTDSADNILCPQITSVVVTILKILGIIGFLINISSFWNIWIFIEPIISIILTIFIILGIKNKNYRYYNWAQIIYIVLTLIETCAIIFILFFFLFVGTIFGAISKTNTETKVNEIIFYIDLSLFLFFIWLLTCVLVLYNKRVRYYCDNINSEQFNNMNNQPLV